MRLRAAVAIAVVAALAGCGGGGGKGGAARTVEKTRVEVVKGLGSKGGFDAEGIYRRLSPGVVTVISLFGGGPPILGGQGEGGLGSGFVIDGDGHIATNAHVVTSGAGARLRRAKSVYIEFADGNRVSAKIVGADPFADVALLKVDPGGLDLTPLTLGASHDLKVGEPVATVGSPFGQAQSLSVGVVSALDRAIESLTAFSIGNAIQTDAAINHGNSGGPLLDAKGQVVGISAQINSDTGQGEGVGFAVPVDTAKRSFEQLRRDGKVHYGFLGVTSEGLYPQLAKRLGLKIDHGALVAKVVKGGPADDAGIAPGKDKISFQLLQDVPKGGDVIVAVDGKPVVDPGDLADLISFRRPGDTVKLRVQRGGATRTVSVKLGERPANTRPTGG